MNPYARDVIREILKKSHDKKGNSQVQDLQATNDRLIKLLKLCVDELDFCPVCWMAINLYGHDPECQLAKELQK